MEIVIAVVLLLALGAVVVVLTLMGRRDSETPPGRLPSPDQDAADPQSTELAVVERPRALHQERRRRLIRYHILHRKQYGSLKHPRRKKG